jgi:predicted SprT family Zn-dependent metalloprotease
MTAMECGDIIKDEIYHCARICRREFSWRLMKLEVRYDVRGTSAGKAWMDSRVRFNLLLLMKQPEHEVRAVVAHEMGHIAVHRLWMERHRHRFVPGTTITVDEQSFNAVMDDAPDPHGREWRKIVLMFGFIPKRVHHFDTTGCS